MDTLEKVLMRNLSSCGERDAKANTKNFLVVWTEGKRQIRYCFWHYNLDAHIFFGNRVNLQRGVHLRKLVTRTLREHMICSYTLNEKRNAEHGLDEDGETFGILALILRTQVLVDDVGQVMFDLIVACTETGLLILEYSENQLQAPPSAKPASRTLDLARTISAVVALRRFLATRGETSPLFCNLQGDAFEAIPGNNEQTKFNESIHRSCEEKVAHLLYFVGKDYIFTDDKKRIGSFLYMLCLLWK